MKITIYELLGMIKDGTIPQKIKFKNNIYEYIEEEKQYYYEDESIWLFEDYMLFTILNDEVEILETTITYKQDKKIEPLKYEEIKWAIDDGIEYNYSEKELLDKINEIINYINGDKE